MDLIVDGNLQKYAVIIGENVTKGARSPSLWNKAFSSLDINAKMFPVDVNKDDNVDSILDELFQDPRFLGGAVGAPLKLDVFRYVSKKNYSDENNIITPVNCFYRHAEGKIEAVNTDILAAIESIEDIRQLVELKNIAIIGNGAISQGLCKELKEKKNKDTLISVFRRNPVLDDFFNSLGCTTHEFSAISDIVCEFDLIVNCTSIGKDGSSNEELLSEGTIRGINQNCLVFDVNYINSPSKFLRTSQSLGLNTIDGVRMNLIQAAIGFHLATGTQYDVTQILELMKET